MLLAGGIIAFLIPSTSNAQFLLQAPNSGDEGNYRWYEASDTSTVLSTDFFYQATTPGVYFATYDGTLCGSNATGYFILTDCSAPANQVTLDISDNITGSATVAWTPAVSGDQQRPVVTATPAVERYTATITKAGNSIDLPRFTVVCMSDAATLVDDLIATDEDSQLLVPVFDNDSDLPSTGTLTATNPSNGSVSINNNGSPNDPSDDLLTYTPLPDYNGPDNFDYTVCNSFGDCSTATVSIDVLPVVDAIDDSLAGNQDQMIMIDFLANDNDIPVTGTITHTSPANGTLVVNDNGTPANPWDDTFSYTPDAAYIGNDTFNYTICDGAGHCSTATVTLVINALGADLDSDDDGIVDGFEDLNLDGDNNPATDPTDTDNDGIPDYLDIDSDDDGLPDNVEAQSTAAYLAPIGIDMNGNGLDDAYEGGSLGLFPEDTDGDNLPDYLDEDSDNDGVPDRIEGHDHDRDGIPEVTFIGSDKDNDGLDDGYEGTTAIDIDVNDEIDDPLNDLPDTDSDGESDYRDVDDDGDGKMTSDEDVNKDGDYTNDDSDGNGIPDYLEANSAEPDLEVFNVVTPNGDGIHDVLAIRGLENYPNNTIKIYNRWGVLVYSTRGYNSQGNVFDGTSQGRATIDQDNKLPVGTYFYILEYEDPASTLRTLNGYIYLNK